MGNMLGLKRTHENRWEIVGVGFSSSLEFVLVQFTLTVALVVALMMTLVLALMMVMMLALMLALMVTLMVALTSAVMVA